MFSVAPPLLPALGVSEIQPATSRIVGVRAPSEPVSPDVDAGTASATCRMPKPCAGTTNDDGVTVMVCGLFAAEDHLFGLAANEASVFPRLRTKMSLVLARSLANSTAP